MPDSLVAGSPAPDVELQDDAGQFVRLSSLWRERPLVLVFIRHLGCPLCRAHCVELRGDFSLFEQAGAELAVVAMGDVASVAAFRRELALPFRMLADAKQESYRLYGLPRGGLSAVAGPRVWWRGLKSILSFGAGRIIGDPMQLPGSFVIDRAGVILQSHHAANSADWLSTEELLAALPKRCDRGR